MPSSSTTRPPVSDSTRVPSRTSTPRERSWSTVYSPIGTLTSGSTRSVASTRVQRSSSRLDAGVGLDGVRGRGPRARPAPRSRRSRRPRRGSSAPRRARPGRWWSRRRRAAPRTWLRRWIASATVLKPIADLGQPGDRQRPRHRARGEDEHVVADLLLRRPSAVRTCAVRAAWSTEVTAAVTIRQPRQHLAQRDHDVPRLERAGGRLGQERLVGHVGARVDDGDRAPPPRAAASAAAARCTCRRSRRRRPGCAVPRWQSSGLRLAGAGLRARRARRRTVDHGVEHRPR